MALKWPLKSIRAVAALFRPLQDIDVYVEDQGSEAFYGELLRRVAPQGLRILRVLPLDGRKNVLAAAQTHDFSSRRALFLVDGDYEWVRADAWDPPNGVYRLDAYCIENLLICEVAATRVLMECCACAPTDAKASLDFALWRSSMMPLVNLFIAWATLNRIDATVPTVSTGLGKLLDGTLSPPVIDLVKVAKVQSDAESAVCRHADGPALLAEIRRRVETLAHPMDAVSGKDFVLPALGHHLRGRTREVPSNAKLKFRLALHVELDRFAGLAAALQRAASGANVHS